MAATLRQVVIPTLRERGFIGSFPHFRRVAPDRIDLLTFRFDKWGGGFVVEVARWNADRFTTHWGEDIPMDKLRADDLHPSERLRLGAESPGEDHWFRFDQNESMDSVARGVVECLDQADAWWTREVR